MPRKCCTFYDGKPCRANYAETKMLEAEKITVYSFPSNPEEQERWKKNLPNVLTCKISKTIGICSKHWSPDCPMKKARGRFLIPTVPPSKFGETNRTYFTQSLVSPSRNIEGRNLTSESRALCAEVLAKEMDTIKCWDSLVKYCCKFSGEFLIHGSDSKRISIFKLIGTHPVVEHSVFISDNFHVEAYRRQSKIPTRDIINGFSNTVTKYSQIDHIINRLKVASVDISSEIRFAGNSILSLLDEFEIDEIDVKKRRQIKFIGTQLLALDCNRYTPDLMVNAVNIYLRSRNEYTTIRELLVLPCPKTIRDYFGKQGIAGSLIECERTLSNVFP